MAISSALQTLAWAQDDGPIGQVGQGLVAYVALEQWFGPAPIGTGWADFLDVVALLP